MISREQAHEYAVLAGQTYSGKNQVAVPEGWQELFHWSPEGGWHNLYAIFVNEKRKEVVFAIRGTTEKFNFLSDLALIAGVFWGEPQTPPGQHEVHVLAASIDYHLNNCFVDPNDEVAAQDIRSIGEAIVQLQGELGTPISKWIMALLYIAAVTAGFYAANQVVPFPVVAQLAMGAVLLGTSMEALRSAGTQVKEGLKMILARKPESFENLKKVIKKNYREFTFKIIGHSLGAVMAELCAAELGVECVTFESPGSLDIMESVSRYEEILHKPGGIKIINYLSAPNLINTLNGHPGVSYRLFLPHTEGTFSFWHATNCVFSSGSRIVAYASLGTFGFAASCVKGAAQKAAFKLAGKAAMDAASAKAAGGLVGLWSEWGWITRQHEIENIAEYLNVNSPLPMRMALVLSWPRSLSVGRISEQVWNFTRSCFFPFQKDLPGIRNLIDEEGMYEAQICRMDGYAVEETQGWPTICDLILPPERVKISREI